MQIQRLEEKEALDATLRVAAEADSATTLSTGVSVAWASV